jgi:peptidoglycan/LPS O-acetylase OafA/YrhL
MLLKLKDKYENHITPSFGVVLDLLRISAALIVVIFHGLEQWFPSLTSPESPYSRAAHTAVIIFFVLSGYVVTYTTSVNNRGGMKYIQARLGRLCSIVIPALIISAICEIVVYNLDPVLHDQYSRSPSYLHYIISVVFANEIWFLSSAPPINGPLWSLSYEFWFYTVFGLWLYCGKGAKRFIITFIGSVIAGPKILLLMPVWLYGSFAYRLSTNSNTRLNIALGVFFFAIAVTATFLFPLYPHVIGIQPLYFAGQFVTDWFLGILIAASLLLLSKIKFDIEFDKVINIIRKTADITFPVYVLHNPIFVLWRAIFGTRLNDSLQMSVGILTVLLLSFSIGHFLEKQRSIWTNFFGYLLSKIKETFWQKKTITDLSLVYEIENKA